MRRITSIMLALTFVLGASAFAQETKPATDKKEKKMKKGKKDPHAPKTDADTTKK